jgi:type II secretory pathway component PulK
VLFVLLLLGLFGAMFSFRIHADVSQVQSIASRLQTRLAAEAGIDAMKILLGSARFDRTQWYHNPDLFHRVLLWAHDTDSRASGTTDELDEKMAYRFSIVADDPTDDEHYVRFGVTDEASKLNLNEATPEQLLALAEQIIVGGEGDEELAPKAIVDAIIDWRDEDSTPSGGAADTEGDYYLNLDKPYGMKNGKFTSVEELLLVKGVTGSVLYGEDFDRNGLLTLNEDDGDESFPPDNQDGVLNRGLFPYLTVLSYENDVSKDNRKRVFLFSDEATLKKELEQVFPDDKEKIDFIVAVTRTGPGTGGDGKKPPAAPGTKDPKSPAPATPGGPVAPGAPNPGAVSPPKPGRGPSASPPPGSGPRRLPGKSSTKKVQDPGPAGSTDKQPGGGNSPRPRQGQPQKPPAAAAPTTGTPPSGVQPPGEEALTEETPPEGESSEGEEKPDPAAETGDGAGEERSIRSPASLLRPRRIGQTDVEGPFTDEDLPLLMDQLTTRRPAGRPTEAQRVDGLINVNTAPPQVLRCLGDLTEEQIGLIIATRDTLDAETLATPAWLKTEGILELDTFEAIASGITARSQQFTIESLGYADHLGMVTRLQAVVDMVGPIAQTIYYRDLSYLGGGYPIREEDKEQVRGR